MSAIAKTRGISAEPLLELQPKAWSQFKIGQLLPGRSAAARPTPGVPQRRFYPRCAEVLPRIPLIVSTAAQAKILNRALAAYRPRVDMVEL